MSTERLAFTVADLHPAVRIQFIDLIAVMIEQYHDKKTEFLLLPFEGYRSPERQRSLGKGVTKAGAWLSPHQFGLAVDFVADLNTRRGPFPTPKADKPHWYWPDASHGDWRVLAEAAASVGLVQNIKWDKPHIESPLFRQMRAALRT